MRLLWLAHLVPFPPTGHGSLQRVHHLLREASRRHDIHLLALAPDAGGSRRDIDAAVGELSAFLASVEVFPLPSNRHGLRRLVGAANTWLRPTSFWEGWYWSPAMYARLRQLSRTCRFDVAQVETVFLGRYLDVLPRVAIVLSHHNVESHLLEVRAQAEGASWARAFLQREAHKVTRLERALTPRVAQNIVVSDLDAQRLRGIVGPASITTVANGVDVDFFRPRGVADAKTGSMIFAGGMNWFPNRDGMEFFVSEIWPALARENPCRQMTVIGRDPPPALVAEAWRDARLRVLGFVDDVRPHIESASIYVCPVRIGGGTRLKILDALAMARPLVSTDLGVEGLALVENEHFLRANTPQEFVSQIRRLEDDPALRRRLARAGRDFVTRHHSWPRIAESLHQTYANAVAAVAAVADDRGIAGQATAS